MDNGKINILSLISSLGYAGAQRAMLTYCRHIDHRFFNMFGATYGGGGIREEMLRKVTVECCITDHEPEKLLSFIREKKIDVVHIHRSGHYITFEYELIKKIKEINKNIIVIETNIFGKYDRLTDPYINCHLVVSKMMLAERFVKKIGYFDFQKMKVLYCPIDKAMVTPVLPHELAAYKQKIGVTENDFVIGRLGRPHIAKWSDLIVEMMPYLAKKIPQVKCILQSIPESRKKRLLQSKLKNHYIFLDPTTDDKEVALFYNTIDVYVHASKIGESFGMTVAEAGLFKKPTVVNSTPARDNAQIEVIDHLQTGIIANHPKTFAEGIYHYYLHPEERETMGENAYAKVTSEYDARKVTEQLEKIIVEKMYEKKNAVSQEILERYQLIPYRPDESEILSFTEEYQKRLSQSYGSVTLRDRVVGIPRVMREMYFKIADIVEDKLHPKA